MIIFLKELFKKIGLCILFFIKLICFLVVGAIWVIAQLVAIISTALKKGLSKALSIINPVK